MLPLIQNQLDAIRAACRRYEVARLELFGSAADAAAFNPTRSDVDFIVAFAPQTDLGPWLAKYFDLRDELRQLLGRPVDLVMEGAMTNPLFLSEANKTRQIVYAADHTQAA
jgi:predicted nucleotidyltransferase